MYFKGITDFAYQDTAAATINTINLTAYDDYSDMTERYSPTQSNAI